jgi:hypothetical protein
VKADKIVFFKIKLDIPRNVLQNLALANNPLKYVDSALKELSPIGLTEYSRLLL